MRRVAMAFASLCLCVPAAAQAEVITVESGDLRAQIETDPWSIAFVDADGNELAAESPGMRIGYRGPMGWAGATRATGVVNDEDAVVAQIETAVVNPAGATPGQPMQVRIAPGWQSTIEIEATPPAAGGPTSLGMGFQATSVEHFYGLGERPAQVDHRGAGPVETYVADGPYYPDPAERAALSTFIPPQGYRERDDATYFPIPWVLSSDGYGVLVENEETAYHDFRGDRQWSLEVTTAPDDFGSNQHAPANLRLRVFGGGSMAKALRRFTRYVGRQPEAPAPWVWGAWFQPGGTVEQQLAQLQKLQQADAPVSVTQTYLHYLPCGAQVDGEEAERERVDAFHARGTAVTTYFNPMICTSYSRFGEAAAAGALATDAGGNPYTYEYSSSPTNRFDVGQFDFSTDAGRSFYGQLLAEAVAAGHDGWMEDFGEYTPLDSHYANGMDGTRMHNLYPTQYHCAAYDFVIGEPRPLIRFQRSGFTGAARCAQVVWSGDPTTGWDFDGLASQIKAGLSMGMSGVSTWGSDIGGFFALSTRELTDELLMRWVQFGAVSPVMRTERNGVAFPEKDRPQVEDDDQLQNWRRYAKLHTRLLPYLQAADRAYRQRGLPIMRHLALAYPNDEGSFMHEDEYLFGPDLLAAPVIEPGATERELYLPPGRWVDFWRSVSYRQKSGRLSLRRARLLDGRREATVPAPLEELPLMVRPGAVLPLLPADVDTLAPYGPGPDAVPLSRRRGRLDLLAFPRGRWKGTFFRGEKLRSVVHGKRWDLAIRGRHMRRYRLQAALPFRACFIETEGTESGHAIVGHRLLRGSFRLRKARIHIRACSRVRR